VGGVTVSGGCCGFVAGDRFPYTRGPVPVVSSLGPTTGSTAGGTSVAITGSSFTTATDVFFGGVPASSFTINSDSSITAVAPPNAAGTLEVTVARPYGPSSLACGHPFIHMLAAAPPVDRVT